jgi:predicted ATPase
MPALDWITIEGFRSIRRIERLKLDRINIIIGANGSGKSNFIGAFSFLNAVREGRLQEYVGRAGGADNVLFFGSRTTQDLHFHLSFEEEVNQYGLHLTTTADGSLVPVSESVYYWNKSCD